VLIHRGQLVLPISYLYQESMQFGFASGGIFDTRVLFLFTYISITILPSWLVSRSFSLFLLGALACPCVSDHDENTISCVARTFFGATAEFEVLHVHGVKGFPCSRGLDSAFRSRIEFIEPQEKTTLVVWKQN
jgi:hypothetical protein